MKKKRVLNTLHSALCLMLLLFVADLAFSASTRSTQGSSPVDAIPFNEGYFQDDHDSGSDTEIIFDVSYPLMLDEEEGEERGTDPGGPGTEEYELPEYKPFSAATGMTWRKVDWTLWADDVTTTTAWLTFAAANSGMVLTAATYGKRDDPVVYGGHVAISKTNHNGWRWAKLSDQAKNQAGQPVNVPENQVLSPKANRDDGFLYFPLKIEANYKYSNTTAFRPPQHPNYEDQLTAIDAAEGITLGHEWLHKEDYKSNRIKDPIWEVLRGTRPPEIYFQVPNNANPNDVLRELVGDPAKARIVEMVAGNTDRDIVWQMTRARDADIDWNNPPPGLQWVLYQRWTVTYDYNGPRGGRRVSDWDYNIRKNGNRIYQMGPSKTAQNYIDDGFEWKFLRR